MTHNPKDVLEVNNEKIAECSAEVAKWNYWDQEHLDIVHDGYVRSDCLYEKDNIFLATHYIKAPLIPFIIIFSIGFNSIFIAVIVNVFLFISRIIPGKPYKSIMP